MIKLDKEIFSKPSPLIYQVCNDEEEFFKLKVKPINSNILSPSSLGVKKLQGDFVIRSLFISRSGKLEDCYLYITMPERVPTKSFFLENGNILEKRAFLKNGEIIPAVAIEQYGVYTLFYSKINPEIGLSILCKGLSVANKKSPIAEDMGYILRDEKRYYEAIEAFTISIQESPSTYFTYVERAQLFDLLKDTKKAEEDWKVVEKLTSKEIVETYRHKK